MGDWNFCSMHQPSMFKGECVVKQKGTLVPQGFTLALGNLDGVWQWMVGIVVPKPHPAMQKPQPEKRRSLQQSQRRCRSADGGLVLIRCCFNKPLEFESWKRRDELQEDVFGYFLHQNWNWLKVFLHGLSAALPPFLHRLQAFKRFSLWLAPDPPG